MTIAQYAFGRTRGVLYLTVVANILALSPVHPARAQAVVRLRATEVLDVPLHSHGDHDARATAAVTLPGDLVAIADVMGGRLLVVDSLGRTIRTIGHRGDDDGGFMHIWWLGRCATDSLYVWDVMMGRLTTLSTSAAVLRHDFELPGISSGATVSAIACDASGSFVYQALPVTLERKTIRGGVARGRANVVISERRSGGLSVIPEVSSLELMVSGGGAAPRPLGALTSLALTPKGVFIGTGDSSVVEVYERNGRYLRTIRVPDSSRPATERDRLRAISETVRQVHGGNDTHVRSLLMQLPPRDSTPPYARLIASLTGALWVVGWPRPDNTVALSQIDANGRVLATCRLPQPLTVFDISSEYVLGSYDDESGLQHVVKYRLSRER